MAQVDTKNIRAYCEPSPPTSAIFPFSFPHFLAGLAFVVYWGIVLFGYDVSAPSSHIPLEPHQLIWAMQRRRGRDYRPGPLHAEVWSQKSGWDHQHVSERSRFRSYRLGTSGWSVLRRTRECSHLRCAHSLQQNHTGIRIVPSLAREQLVLEGRKPFSYFVPSSQSVL